MRILVCEFVTGGGMPPSTPIPASLAHEGDLMLRALIGDLLDVPGVDVTVTRDARLAPLPPPIRSITVNDPRESWVLWEELSRTADAVWPIAPETDGAMERVCRMVEASGRRLLASHAEAVAITASKAATASALAAAGLPVAQTWRTADLSDPPWEGPWVVKPDDGAGCVDTLCLRDHAAWAHWRGAGDRSGFVVQPFVSGTPASLSMLCRDGQAWLLAVNRQDIVLSGPAFTYRGGVVGGVASSPELHALASGVAAALPGLFGYVGVDFIAGVGGPMILEVNPRLTTSYVGLRRATGMNVAAAVLGLAQEPMVIPGPVERVEPVHLSLEEMAWNPVD